MPLRRPGPLRGAAQNWLRLFFGDLVMTVMDRIINSPKQFTHSFSGIFGRNGRESLAAKFTQMVSFLAAPAFLCFLGPVF